MQYRSTVMQYRSTFYIFKLFLSYNVSETLLAEANVKALNRAFNLGGINQYPDFIHHSVKGIQYIYDVYVKSLKQYNIKISMCDSHYENAFAERINGTIKNEYLIPKKHHQFQPTRVVCNLLKKVNRIQARLIPIPLNLDHNHQHQHFQNSNRTPCYTIIMVQLVYSLFTFRNFLSFNKALQIPKPYQLRYYKSLTRLILYFCSIYIS